MPHSTFIMFKPDAMNRHLTEPILSIFKNNGYQVKRSKLIQVSESLILDHYRDVIIRVNLPHLQQAMIDTWVNQIVLICEMTKDCDDIILDSRTLIGATDPIKAEKNTIRGIYGNDAMEKAIFENRVVRNLVHASDSIESAKKEIKLWFDTRR